MQARTGILVAFEGIDGAGKTTQARRLEERLRAESVPVLRTKEPTDGPWGRKLRESAATGRLPVQQEYEYFLKDREEHVAGELGPALARGEVVIIDRYYFSSMAYQGARGLDPAMIRRTNEAIAPVPDLLVHLDIDVSRAMARIAERDGRGNLFEQEEDLRRAAAIFRSVEGDFVLRLDGGLGAEELAEGIHRRVVGIRAARA